MGTRLSRVEYNSDPVFAKAQRNTVCFGHCFRDLRLNLQMCGLSLLLMSRSSVTLDPFCMKVCANGAIPTPAEIFKKPFQI